MKYLLITLAILLIGCNKDALEPRPYEFGSIAFSVSPPKTSTTAKVPSCKDIEPNEVRYNLTNGRGEDYTYTSPIDLINDVYVSSPTETLPFGNYTMNDVLLINGNDTIYALPHEYETHLSLYWNLKLPYIVTVNGTETITGTVFCFNEYQQPDPEGDIESSFDAFKTQSLYFSVFDSGCIDKIEVYYDGKTTKNLLVPDQQIHHIAVPLEYTTLEVRAYIGQDMVQFYRFTTSYRYNGDGVMNTEDLIMFNYICI